MFNVFPGTRKLVSGINISVSNIGDRRLTSFNVVAHPYASDRHAIVRTCVGHKCRAFISHYTSNHNVSASSVGTVTRNHM